MTYTLQANEPRLTPSIKNWIQANSKDFTIKEMAEKLGTYPQLIGSYCNHYDLPRKKAPRMPRPKKILTQAMIEEQIKENEILNNKLNEIIEGVAKAIGFTVNELRSKKRIRHLVLARQICYYIAYKDECYTYKSIGESLGQRDHSTVMHGINKIIDYAKTKDTLFEKYLEAIKEKAPHIHSKLLPAKSKVSTEPCNYSRFKIQRHA